MASYSRSIPILLMTSGLLLLGNGLLVTLLPLRATFEDFSPSMIGAMGTAFFAGFAIGCLLGPRLLIRVGHIRAYAGFAALCAISILILELFPSAFAWTVIRGLNGLFFAVLYMVIESWLNEESPSEIRGQVLSLYIIIANLATMGGQLMVNLASVESHKLFTLTAILAALSLVPLSLAQNANPKPVETAKINILRLYRLSPTGFLGCFIIGLAEGAFWTLGPVFGQARSMSLAEVTYFMAAFMAGGTISQWPLGRWSDKVDRRIVMAICCLVALCTALSLAFVPFENPAISLGLAVLHGAFMLPLYALCLAHANDYAPSEALVETSGGLLLVYSAGAILGPVIVGPLMDLEGPYTLFVTIAVLFAVFAVYCILRMTLRKIADPLQRVLFVALPRTTPTLYGLEEDQNGDEDN
ncbi:MAG: MFS transporter [Kiloniellales bacterium]|nr:MFS transporter [Kiloniellales bacterium]